MITEKRVQKAIRDASSSGKGGRAEGRGSTRRRPPGVPGGARRRQRMVCSLLRRRQAEDGEARRIPSSQGLRRRVRTFSRDWAPEIAKGEDPSVARRQAAAAGTLGDLCDAYVAHLGASGKRTVKPSAGC